LYSLRLASPIHGNFLSGDASHWPPDSASIVFDAQVADLAERLA